MRKTFVLLFTRDILKIWFLIDFSLKHYKSLLRKNMAGNQTVFFFSPQIIYWFKIINRLSIVINVQDLEIDGFIILWPNCVVFIIKTKVLLPQAYEDCSRFRISRLGLFGFIAPKHFWINLLSNPFWDSKPDLFSDIAYLKRWLGMMSCIWHHR